MLPGGEREGEKSPVWRRRASGWPQLCTPPEVGFQAGKPAADRASSGKGEEAVPDSLVSGWGAGEGPTGLLPSHLEGWALAQAPSGGRRAPASPAASSLPKGGRGAVALWG